MLRLLLDEHLSPRIARQFRAKFSGSQIESIVLWEDGCLRGVADDVVFAEAHKQGWTLVTYDLATITPLLKIWAEQGIAHGGVILVDQRTVAPNEIGGLIRSLASIWNQEKNRDWTNVVIYLQAP